MIGLKGKIGSMSFYYLKYEAVKVKTKETYHMFVFHIHPLHLHPRTTELVGSGRFVGSRWIKTIILMG